MLNDFFNQQVRDQAELLKLCLWGLKANGYDTDNYENGIFLIGYRALNVCGNYIMYGYTGANIDLAEQQLCTAVQYIDDMDLTHSVHNLRQNPTPDHLQRAFMALNNAFSKHQKQRATKKYFEKHNRAGYRDGYIV